MIDKASSDSQAHQRSEAPSTAKCPFCAHTFELAAAAEEVSRAAQNVTVRPALRRPPALLRAMFWVFRKLLAAGPGRWFHDFDVDVVLSDTHLLVEVMSTPLAFLVVITTAMAAGGSALMTGQLEFATICMAAGAFAAAVLQPENAWRWAMLEAAAIPTIYGMSETLGISTYQLTWTPMQFAIPMALPLVTAYVGVFIRFVLGKLFRTEMPMPQAAPIRAARPAGLPAPASGTAGT